MNTPQKAFSLPMATPPEQEATTKGSSGSNDHNHGSHSHGHGGPTEILMQAILCGCLGLVGIFLYLGGKVEIILAPKFHSWLLAGSITLVLLAFIRIISVWISAGSSKKTESIKEEYCDHDGNHSQHTHHHHDDLKGCESHTCDHDHSHGYEPIKAVVLMIPVGLFLLNLPNSSFAAVQALDLNNVDISTNIADRGTENNVSFLQLERAAQRDEARQLYEGKTVVLVGKYAGNDDKKFTLIRFKMNCCAADAVPLKGAMFVDSKNPAKLDYKIWNDKWVKVKGQVQFIKMKDGSYITALVLKPKDDNDLNGEWIQETVPDSIYLLN